MAERWISQSENLLKAIEKQSAKTEKDRLETVHSMILALNAVDRSLHGWRSWVGSLRLMSRFTEDELRAMEAGLIERVRAFVEYDLEVTQKHKDKISSVSVTRRKRQERSEASSVYV